MSYELVVIYPSIDRSVGRSVPPSLPPFLHPSIYRALGCNVQEVAALGGLSITVGFTEEGVSSLVYQDDEKGSGKKKGGENGFN